jgi:hypothetical protein
MEGVFSYNHLCGRHHEFSTFLTVLQVHRECFSCGISDSFQSLWTEWIEATLHGTLFIRHDVDWKYSFTEVVRRACCFDLPLAQALACVCDWVLVMGTWLKRFVILPGTIQVITRNIQIFSYTDPDYE